MNPDPSKPGLPKGARRTALLCAGFAAGMLGLAYASVPLYDLFCRVTGYDGTPLSGRAPSPKVLDRTIAVRFDANVAAGLGPVSGSRRGGASVIAAGSAPGGPSWRW